MNDRPKCRDARRCALERLSVFVVTSACAFGALAQNQNPKMQAIDQGVADTGPLSVSERLMPKDLRVPSAFERVYRLSGKHSGQYARISGAITAVFPRSQYVLTDEGEVPVIPAGTIFYVGGLPQDRRLTPEITFRRASNYFDTSARVLPDAPGAPRDFLPYSRNPPTVPIASALPVGKSSIFTDEMYRRMRVADLLNQATRRPADDAER